MNVVRSCLFTCLVLGAVACGASPLTSVSVLAAAPIAADGPSAFYRASVQYTWSRDTHGAAGYPTRRPGQGIIFEPHFTNFTVVTHAPAYSLYTIGNLASRNIEGTAEAAQSEYFRAEWPANRAALGTNAYAGCLAEQQAADPSEFDRRCLFVQGARTPAPADAATSFVFEVLPEFPLVSMAAMLAPSPDWFIGVSGVSLRNGDSWIDTVTLDLFATDAGTERNGGWIYNGPAESPQRRIRLITGAPFFGIPVGAITFERVSTEGPDAVALRNNEPLFEGFTDGAVPTPTRLGD